jgi:hypothetical protein
MTDKTRAEAYQECEKAREDLLVYSRRMGLVLQDAQDTESVAPDLALTAETDGELTRLEKRFNEALATYQAALDAEAERIRDEIVQQRTKDLYGE